MNDTTVMNNHTVIVTAAIPATCDIEIYLSEDADAGTPTWTSIGTMTTGDTSATFTHDFGTASGTPVYAWKVDMNTSGAPGATFYISSIDIQFES